jgi:hypothetical protein
MGPWTLWRTGTRDQRWAPRQRYLLGLGVHYVILTERRPQVSEEPSFCTNRVTTSFTSVGSEADRVGLP